MAVFAGTELTRDVWVRVELLQVTLAEILALESGGFACRHAEKLVMATDPTGIEYRQATG